MNPGLRRTGGRIVAGLLLAAALVLAPAAPEAREAETVILLKNREFAPALLSGIREARSSVLLATYLFKTTDTRGNLPRAVVEELIRARQRGVDVTVVLETSTDGRDNLNRENRRTARLLSRGGVRVFFDAPGVTSHAKVAVMDGRRVFLGSHNLTQGALARNNELSPLVDSPELAAQVKSWFDRL